MHQRLYQLQKLPLPFLSARRVEKGLQTSGHLADLLDRPADPLRGPIQVQDQTRPQALGRLQPVRPLGDYPRLVVARLWPSDSCHRLASTDLTLFCEGAIAGLRPWPRATPRPAMSLGRELGAGPGGKTTCGDSPRPSPSAPRIGRGVRKLFNFPYFRCAEISAPNRSRIL